VAIAAAAWFAVSRGGAGAKPRSIAVLPTDIGADTAHAYLADGLSNELTTKLSKIPGLSVRAYSSSRVMRGKGAREAGKELGVGAILTATMTRSGAQLRVTASLVNATNDELIWSDSFTENDQDQFALQDKLVNAIAGALKISLSPATQASVTARGTRSTEAHELVQRARFMTDQFTGSSLRSAVTLAESAIALDSSYADAWAALAEAWGYLADDFVPAAEAGPKMRHAAERALALDPNLADAHAEMAAWLHYYGHDIAGATKEYERALLLDSANVVAGIWYPGLLGSPGLRGDSAQRADSARAIQQRTLRLNPLSFNVWTFVMPGAAEIALFSTDSATALCQTAARISDRLGAQCQASRSFAARDYRAAAEADRRLAGATPSGRELAQLALNLLGDRDTVGARDALKRAVERSRTEYVREDLVARAFMSLGDRERAIEWMVKGGASNVAGILNLESSPMWAPIRSDPRIQAVIKRIKQPQ
jgi:serine/threonine-protein kinase